MKVEMLMNTFLERPNKLSEKEKLKLLAACETYEDKIKVLSKCSAKTKVEKILTEKYLDYSDIIYLLSSISIDALIQFLREHHDFLAEKGISPYLITIKLGEREQKEIAYRLEETGLSTAEKKEILVSLNENVKESIDANRIDEKCRVAISIKFSNISYDAIFLDLNRNLEDYCGLDNLMVGDPEKFTEEQRIKFMRLCDICPDMIIESRIKRSKYGLLDVNYLARASEYREGEEWIQSVINGLDPNYTDAQKLAAIDNAVGKRISYSPDLDTEIFDSIKANSMWRIIASGYGTCEGISKIMQYILNRVRNRK